MSKMISLVIVILFIVLLVNACTNEQLIVNEELNNNDSFVTENANISLYYDEYDYEDFKDVKVVHLEFGSEFKGEIKVGCKYDFATDELVEFNLYDDTERLLVKLDNSMSEHLQKALMDLELHNWKWGYYNYPKESDSTSTSYDGGWMILIRYDNGYEKSITGFGIIPPKGKAFEAVLRDYFDYGWSWYL